MSDTKVKLATPTELKIGMTPHESNSDEKSVFVLTIKTTLPSSATEVTDRGDTISEIAAIVSEYVRSTGGS